MKLEENKKENYVESVQPPYSAQHPWLLICHGDMMRRQTFFSVSENRYYMKSISELKEKKICAYADEWLVLESIYSYSSECYLWNIISNDKIQLPPLPAKCNILKCLLSAPPHDPECQVIFLIKETETTSDDDDTNEDENSDGDGDENYDDDEDENSDGDGAENDDDDEDVNLLTFYFCKPGYNEEFHKQDAQSIIGDSHLDIWTVFKKRIYMIIGCPRILMCLDPDNDSGRITATPMTNRAPDLSRKYSDHPLFKDYIIQSSSNDMLLYVHLISNGREYEMPYHFRVFRFDFVRKRWIKVESIGEIAIFISFPGRLAQLVLQKAPILTKSPSTTPTVVISTSTT